MRTFLIGFIVLWFCLPLCAVLYCAVCSVSKKKSMKRIRRYNFLCSLYVFIITVVVVILVVVIIVVIVVAIKFLV